MFPILIVMIVAIGIIMILQTAFRSLHFLVLIGKQVWWRRTCNFQWANPSNFFLVWDSILISLKLLSLYLHLKNTVFGFCDWIISTFIFCHFTVSPICWISQFSVSKSHRTIPFHLHDIEIFYTPFLLTIDLQHKWIHFLIHAQYATVTLSPSFCVCPFSRKQCAILMPWLQCLWLQWIAMFLFKFCVRISGWGQLRKGSPENYNITFYELECGMLEV